MATGEDSEYTRRFAELFEQLYTEFFTWLGPRMKGKNMKFGRIIPVEQSIHASPGIGVLAWSTDRVQEVTEMPLLALGKQDAKRKAAEDQLRVARRR